MLDCRISIHIKVTDEKFMQRLRYCVDESFDEYAVENPVCENIIKKIAPYMQYGIPPELFVDNDSDDIELLISVDEIKSCYIEDIIVDLLSTCNR